MMHNVHVYREMKLFFPAIEADDQRQAARIAMAMPTAEAANVEDCDGSTVAALVDVVSDAEHEKSRVFAAPSTIATPIFGTGMAHIHEIDPLGTIRYIEVEGCEEDDEGNVTRVDSDEPQFWSVYARYQPSEGGEIGGVDCIADFATKQDACSYARQIGLLLGVPSEA